MFRYLDFRCENGHEFETLIDTPDFAAKKIQTAKCKECEAIAFRIEKIAAPAMSGFTDRGAAAVDEAIYRQHNVTHTDILPTGNGGRVKRSPAPKGAGCTCGNCASHCRRASVTGVAAPGKEF